MIINKNRHWDETLRYWEQVYQHYKRLKTDNKTVAEIAYVIGISERQLYRIIKYHNER